MSLFQRWTFDSAAGGLIHDSGPNAFTGTLSGTNIPTVVVGPPGTNIPHALHFDGTGYVIGSAGSGFHALPNSAFAVSVWFRTSIPPIARQTFIFSRPALSWLEVYQSVAPGNLSYAGPGFQLTTTPTVVVQNVWVHLFLQRNAIGVGSAWANGVPVAVFGVNSATWTENPTESAVLGCRTDATLTTFSQFLTGDLADLRVYDNVDWTNRQIADIYMSSFLQNPLQLVAD